MGKTENSDFIVDSIDVYGRGSIGCIRTNTEIQVSYVDNNGNDIDLYFSEEKIRALKNEINAQLRRNKEHRKLFEENEKA